MEGRCGGGAMGRAVDIVLVVERLTCAVELRRVRGGPAVAEDVAFPEVEGLARVSLVGTCGVCGVLDGLGSPLCAMSVSP